MNKTMSDYLFVGGQMQKAVELHLLDLRTAPSQHRRNCLLSRAENHRVLQLALQSFTSL